ncbi:hypothetical protein [Agathobaculum hominis]|nr:hypothetical protein [Agathobaculum hominis]
MDTKKVPEETFSDNPRRVRGAAEMLLPVFLLFECQPFILI